MIDVAKYVYENYTELRKFPYWNVLSLLDRNADKVICVRENGNIVGVGLYAKIKDDTLWKIKNGFLDISEPVILNQILSENGNNVHFIGVTANSYRTLSKGLKEVISREHPKTVSWFSKDMKRFIERKV